MEKDVIMIPNFYSALMLPSQMWNSLFPYRYRSWLLHSWLIKVWMASFVFSHTPPVPPKNYSRSFWSFWPHYTFAGGCDPRVVVIILLKRKEIRRPFSLVLWGALLLNVLVIFSFVCWQPAHPLFVFSSSTKTFRYTSYVSCLKSPGGFFFYKRHQNCHT